MQTEQPTTASTLLAQLNLDELLAILKKQKDKLKAINETETAPAMERGMRESLAQETTLIFDEINRRLSPYNAKITFNEEGIQIENFIFSKLNPLDSLPVKEIIGCEIISTNIHFQCIDKDGKKYMRKTLNCGFIMEQVEQHHISIEAIQ